MTLAPLLFRESMKWMRYGNPSRCGARSGASHRRRLQIERLENRQLLAITVDTLVDENDGIGVGGISLRDAIAAASRTKPLSSHQR